MKLTVAIWNLQKYSNAFSIFNLEKRKKDERKEAVKVPWTYEENSIISFFFKSNIVPETVPNKAMVEAAMQKY